VKEYDRNREGGAWCKNNDFENIVREFVQGRELEVIAGKTKSPRKRSGA
jgi:hypothetical protein